MSWRGRRWLSVLAIVLAGASATAAIVAGCEAVRMQLAREGVSQAP